MGRMIRPSVHRRGLLDRPFLLFGLLLLLPATGFGFMGWTSVVRERALHEREARVEAEDVLALRMKEAVEGLDALASREADRPYFVYQRLFVPEETSFGQLDFQPSPLTRAPEDPRIRGWFQWEEGRKGPFLTPQVFGPASRAWASDLEETYGPWLRARLAAASGEVSDADGGRTVVHRLRVVAANEERGQLFEEFQIVQGQQALAAKGNGAPAPTATPYLEAFRRRVSDAPVSVRYGPFHYVARSAAQRGPPLVAWRRVFVPGVHAAQREAGRARWLLQGYVLDPGTAFPMDWETVGTVRICRQDRAGQAVTRHDVAFASLADALDATVLAGEATKATADPSLALVALPDRVALAADHVSARARYLWMLGGVLAVVLIGFVVLTRGMRRELALARRKEDFLAAVTHELKTPLAGIRLHAEMLREGWVSDPEAAQRYAGRLIDESDRLGHLVDQVLDLAALERGVARAHARPGDLGACVRGAIDLVRPRAEHLAFSLDVVIADDLPPVTFDPRLVKPLVLNLLDNALKYGAKAPRREIRVAVHAEPGAVVLEVRDTGPGIDPALCRHVFEPFQRGGDELTRTAPGVGIGLTLVKRYAEAHDAAIELESEPGRGTMVRVRFRPSP